MTAISMLKVKWDNNNESITDIEEETLSNTATYEEQGSHRHSKGPYWIL